MSPADAADAPTSDEHRLFAFTLERIVFFSDAVFAIAITLLAIELRLPDLPAYQTDASFLAALADVLPALFAFVLSFTVIAAFWVGHYRTFRYVVDADGRLVAINFAFLFCIAILPFPTSIIARQGDLPSATIIYAAFGVATGALSTLLWVYPSQIANLALPTVTPSIARYVTYRAAVIPIVFALSIPVAIVGPAAGLGHVVRRRADPGARHPPVQADQRFARPAIAWVSGPCRRAARRGRFRGPRILSQSHRSGRRATHRDPACCQPRR